jgi:hypothetical protein
VFPIPFPFQFPFPISKPKINKAKVQSLNANIHDSRARQPFLGRDKSKTQHNA